MNMRIIRMHCPSQSAQDYRTEPVWQVIARELDYLVMNSAYFGPFNLPDGNCILRKKDIEDISRQTGCKAAISHRPQWGGRKLTISGPPERLQEARELSMKKIANNACYEASKAAPRTPPVRPERGNNRQLQARGNRRLSWWPWCYLVPLIMAFW